jgi:nicotinate dehydrogenase subunit B
VKNPVLPADDLASLFARSGIVAVVRGIGSDRVPEPFVVLLDDGSITGFNGHVDLGTGIRTSLAQIVAEELDADYDAVRMMLGDTAWTPDQGPTVASETLQFTAIPLRCAAAQARRLLLDLASRHLAVPSDTLRIDAGTFSSSATNMTIGFGDLVRGCTIIVELDEAAPVKPVEEYRIVGRSVPRVDVAAKATGELVFVHDMRVPGMLHGRVVRPPYGGRDSGGFVGATLRHVDRGSIAHIPGIVDLVVINDWIGIVAEREEAAEAAMRALVAEWTPPPALPDLNAPEEALRGNSRTTRKLVDRGDVDAALDAAAVRMQRTYVWPYQMHGSIGPVCALAAFDPDGALTLWSGTQTQHALRADLALLLDMPESAIRIVRMEASGSYGRSGADDVAADAALLARAVGRPVRVQLTRDQEHVWEPKGAAQLMEVDGGIDAGGAPLAYDYQSSYPSNMAPTLALLLTRMVEAVPAVHTAGDRTAIPPYAYPNLRIQIHDMPTIARAAFFRGVSALPTSFAHESYVDELAEAAGVDPVEYRLRYLEDERAITLVREVAASAGWDRHVGPRQRMLTPDIAHGRGFAYAVYVHGPWPGKAAAYAAWATDVEVNRTTGEIVVTRVVAGQDTGMMVNPDGVRHQIQGNVVQATSRATMEQVGFDRQAVRTRDWSTYPILPFPKLPRIQVVMIPRPNDPPLGAGESASVPSAAAIANAVYDAIGVRLREAPFTPERVLAALGQNPSAPVPDTPPPTSARRVFPWKALLAGAAALAGSGTMLWPLKSAIPPIARPASDIFSAATIERGRQLAEAGDCAVCHTAPGGAVNAGGRGLDTPFGRVIATNITPDVETGIGAWSYPAFERAMRQGVSRDGRHLYPVFPYTAFTRMRDEDLQALYAYLMAQPAVRQSVPQTRLAFPFNQRWLLAGWNALNLRPGPLPSVPDRSAAWNRGAYLVESVGHCSACHSPRDALGAEVLGAGRWAGGFADGWEAPPLGKHIRTPVAWTRQELYAYLRTGASDLHGPAMGPMAPVVAGLRALPDADIRAIATYLTSLGDDEPSDVAVRMEAVRLTRTGEQARAADGGPAARLFDTGCAMCHGADAPALFGARLPLALNSNVHAERPDNLIHTLLNGVADPANPARGAMPAYRHIYDDGQIADLARFIRRTQAPGQPAWNNVEQAVAHIRREPVERGVHGSP